MHSVAEAADVEAMAHQGFFWVGIELLGWCPVMTSLADIAVSFELPYHVRYPRPLPERATSSVVIPPPHAIFVAPARGRASSTRRTQTTVVFDRDHLGRPGNAPLYPTLLEVNDFIAPSPPPEEVTIAMPSGPLQLEALVYLSTVVVYTVSSLLLTWLLVRHRPRCS